MNEQPIAVAKDRERSFAAAIRDMTDHDAKVKNSGVTVTISIEEHEHSATLNTLGQLTRAYGMSFYTGSLSDGSEHILRFGTRTDY
jgi:hypothetical protein